MKPYESYKKTDQLWLLHIPAHWNIVKLKYLFTERTEKGYPEEPLLVASQNMGVVPKHIYGNRTVEAQKDLHLLKLVKIGDFVISLRSFQGGIEYAYYQGIISPAYTIMVSHTQIRSGYFRHLAKSKVFVELLQMCVTGIREGQNIDYSKLKNFRLPLPPTNEQDQIVRFLDWRLSKINKLIKAKKKQIALLNEQKQAIINQAVTKGLDDNVPMKDSGVEWLGEVAASFSLCTLQRVVAKIESGTSVNATNIPASLDEIGVLSTSCVYRYNFDINQNKRVESFDLHRVSCCVKADTIIVSRMNTPTLVGASGYVKETAKNIFLPDRLWQVSFCNDVLPEYIALFLSSTRVRKWFSYVATGSSNTMKNLSQTQFLSTTIPLPNLHQQEDILFWCKEKSKNIDNIIDKLQQEMDLISEYKTSLISSVVTGQVDVRDIAVPEFEPEDEPIEDTSEEDLEEAEETEEA